jgi:hypothetical protein
MNLTFVRNITGLSIYLKLSNSGRSSSRQEIYLKTLAILKKIGADTSKTNFQQAFRFFWENMTFKEDQFRKAMDSAPSMKEEIDEIILKVTDDDCERMRIALTDAYHTISRGAEIAGLDKSMVRRLVENGTLNYVLMRNPYYRNSPPMKLIRMSDLNTWIRNNPKAVELSRKTLERSNKAKQTRSQNQSRKIAPYRDRINSVIREFNAISERDPVLLLWILLKLMQITTINQQLIKEFYGKNILRIARMTNPDSMTLRNVIDLEERDIVKLCDICAADAAALKMTEEEYLIHFGKCSNCTSEKRIVKSGKHHELIYSRGDISLIFTVGGSLFREIMTFIPKACIDQGTYLSDTRGNWWDSIPRSAIPFNFMQILEIMSDTYSKMENLK